MAAGMDEFFATGEESSWILLPLSVISALRLVWTRNKVALHSTGDRFERAGSLNSLLSGRTGVTVLSFRWATVCNFWVVGGGVVDCYSE